MFCFYCEFLVKKIAKLFKKLAELAMCEIVWFEPTPFAFAFQSGV